MGLVKCEAQSIRSNLIMQYNYQSMLNKVINNIIKMHFILQSDTD